MSIAGIVIAAGRSKRFGDDNKLLATAAGRPLAAWAAAAMLGAPVSRRIAVVADAAVARVFEGFDIVMADAGAKQSDSLRLGVAAARAAGASCVLLALADMPGVTAQDMAAVLRAQRGHAPAAAWLEGRPMPPAAFPAAWFPTLETLQGDRGAGALLARAEDLAPVRLAPSHLIDIDTPDDLARWLVDRAR